VWRPKMVEQQVDCSRLRALVNFEPKWHGGGMGRPLYTLAVAFLSGLVVELVRRAGSPRRHPALSCLCLPACKVQVFDPSRCVAPVPNRAAREEFKVGEVL
jgi:hypothetical protein